MQTEFSLSCLHFRHNATASNLIATVHKNLVLIAGYPKSGSTWLRVVFEVLLHPGCGGLSVNELPHGYYGAWRRVLFDDFAPANAADLPNDDVDDDLSCVFEALSATTAQPVLIKAHDVAHRTRSGDWIFPPGCVRAVVYLVRHPFDVAVSYAHHLDVPVEDAVDMMGRDLVIGESFGKARLPLHERIGSWSGNIESWLDAEPYDVTVARYEDIHADPVFAFARLALAAGFPAGQQEVAAAVEAGSFERLRRQEAEQGFDERPRTSRGFFRSGRPGTWQGSLSEDMRAKLVREHGAVMSRLGYTDDGRALAVPIPGCAAG